MYAVCEEDEGTWSGNQADRDAHSQPLIKASTLDALPSFGWERWLQKIMKPLCEISPKSWPNMPNETGRMENHQQMSARQSNEEK